MGLEQQDWDFGALDFFGRHLGFDRWGSVGFGSAVARRLALLDRHHRLSTAKRVWANVAADVGRFFLCWCADDHTFASRHDLLSRRRGLWCFQQLRTCFGENFHSGTFAGTRFCSCRFGRRQIRWFFDLATKILQLVLLQIVNPVNSSKSDSFRFAY